eukprot:13827-Heterococcus_DN1.PRE.1
MKKNKPPTTVARLLTTARTPPPIGMLIKSLCRRIRYMNGRLSIHWPHTAHLGIGNKGAGSAIAYLLYQEMSCLLYKHTSSSVLYDKCQCVIAVTAA